MIVGVDEAGRGPAIGSMFAAAVGLADPADLPDGIDDSKRLTPARRERLAAEVRECATVGVAQIPPSRIDDPATDMNALTVEAQAAAIDSVLGEFSDPEIVADACDTDEARFAGRVSEAISADLSVTAEHRADENHAIVAAASVIAKVERDAHVATLAEEFGDLGSGYPSDPTTKEFLATYVDEHGEVPPCARSSWETCRRLVAEREQRGLGDF